MVGRYVHFSFDGSTFAVYIYTLTAAANPEDLTGGLPTTVFAGTVPETRRADARRQGQRPGGHQRVAERQAQNRIRGRVPVTDPRV
jgi:hypothetical protein